MNKIKQILSLSFFLFSTMFSNPQHPSYNYIEENIFRKNNSMLILTSDISDMLAAERIASTIKMKTPKTTFVFATPSLESKLAAEKLFKSEQSYEFYLAPKGDIEASLHFFQRINPAVIILIGQEIAQLNILFLAKAKDVPVYAFNTEFSHQTNRLINQSGFYMIPLINTLNRIYTLHDKDTQQLLEHHISKPALNTMGNLNSFNITQERKNYLKKSNMSDEALKTMFPYHILLASPQSKSHVSLYLSLYKIARLQYPNIKMIFVIQDQLSWTSADLQSVKNEDLRVSMLNCNYLWDNKQTSIYQSLESSFDKNDILFTSRYASFFFLQAIATVYLTNSTQLDLKHQSFIEAAAWKVPIILGPTYHASNTDINEELQNEIVVITAETEQELISKTLLLLDDKEFREGIGEHSYCGLLKTSYECGKTLLPFFKEVVTLLLTIEKENKIMH